MTHEFDPDFVWGSATSAYQVEGGWDADGKVPSVWDTALHGTLRTPDGTSGDTAIDQYHRLDEDLDLLQKLGAGAHRFSTSWPRIVTDARGTINPAGLAYYDRLVDGLLQRGIAPALCLYHWDTPQWLEDLGGMMTRDFADRFAEYAAVLGTHLGDRVAQWYTMNEPVNPSLGGYLIGGLPPYRRQDVRSGLAAGHHLLLAHGQSVLALRSAGVAGDIGAIISIGGVAPATTHPDDIRAAERAEYFEGRLFLDPVLGRGHLPEVAAVLGDVVHDGDDDIIGQPLDVLGVNWYSQYSAAAPERAAAHMRGVPERGKSVLMLAAATAPLGFALVPTPGAVWGGAHRQLTPGGFRRALDWLSRTYPDHPDLVITENGVGGADLPGADGTVHDDERISYLSWALCELRDAIADGARVRGYHVWSSFDNFQWMAGFAQRFGLIHVDPHTLVRTPKASFAWFSELVRTGIVPEDTTPPAAGDHRGLEVAGVRNVRGVGGLRMTDGSVLTDGTLLRSAGLHALTDEGAETLRSLGVRTVIDLRGDNEVLAAPSRDFGARHVHLPLWNGADNPQEIPDLAHLYEEIVSSSGELIVAGIREILRTEGDTALVHCTAGKDRTGIFTAMVLSAAGVCDDDVVRTYAESESRLGEPFAREVKEHWGGIDLPPEMLDYVLSSPAELMTRTLSKVRHDYGSTWEYLFAHGLTEEELTALETKLRP